jgi:hypothetical protein
MTWIENAKSGNVLLRNEAFLEISKFWRRADGNLHRLGVDGDKLRETWEKMEARVPPAPFKDCVEVESQLEEVRACTEEKTRLALCKLARLSIEDILRPDGNTSPEVIRILADDCRHPMAAMRSR